MNVTLDHVEDIAAGVKTYWFKPERPVRYAAGEYLEVFLPHPNADNRGERRWFSLTSSPSEPLLGVTVKFEEGGGSSFKQTLLSIQPGTQLVMTDPMGDFVLPKDRAIPLVFIAAGIGITPVRGMVQWLTDTGEKRNLQLVYITPTVADMFFLPLFEKYEGLQLSPIHTQNKRPDVIDIIRIIGDPAHKLVYLSGPQFFIEGLWSDLQEHHIDRGQLILDYFPGYSQL